MVARKKERRKESAGQYHTASRSRPRANRRLAWPSSAAPNSTTAAASAGLPPQPTRAENTRPQRHLHAAVQPGGRADAARVQHQHLAQHRRAGQAGAQHEAHHQPHRPHQRQPAAQLQQQEGGAAGHAQAIAPQQQPLHAPAPGQAAGQQAAGGDAQHDHCQRHAHIAQRPPQLRRDDERRGSDEGIDRGGRAAAAHGVAEEGGRAQQHAIVARQPGRAQAPARRGGLGHQAPGQHQRRRAQQRQQGEHGAPAAQQHQARARQRRQPRAGHHREVEQRQRAHRIGRRVRVAHHGPAQGQAGAAAQRLHQPRGNQQRHAGRQHRADAAQHVQRQPSQQRRAPPQRVRQRPVDELAQRQPGDVGADGRLHGGAADLEVARGVGQRRHEHVHGQRAAERDERQQPQRHARAAGRRNGRGSKGHERRGAARAQES